MGIQNEICPKGSRVVCKMNELHPLYATYDLVKNGPLSVAFVVHSKRCCRKQPSKRRVGGNEGGFDSGVMGSRHSLRDSF